MKIVFIQTGGTIDKDYPRFTGGYAFEFGSTENDYASFNIIHNYIGLNSLGFQPIFASVCTKDSQEITEDDRLHIFECILNYAMTQNISHFVITHGTDTMIETGIYLQMKFEENISGLKNDSQIHIILTGAMKPAKFIASDAQFNIGCAVVAVQTIPNRKVFLTMNGRIFHVSNVQRNLENGLFQEITNQTSTNMNSKL